MQHTVGELKEKLSRALDKENNVVDMLRVLEVVSALEKSNVTRECLEETRIGKYINEMRKKTSNKDLAKRAKNLVRKWQQLLVPQASTPASFNGDKLAKSVVPQHIKTVAKPASPSSRPDTPLSSNSNSPALQKYGRSGTPHSQSNRLSPAVSQKSGIVGFKPISPALQTPVRSSSSMCVERNSPLDTPRSHNGHSDRACTPSDDSQLYSSVTHKRKRKDGCEASDIPDKKRVLSANSDSVYIGSKTNSVMNGLVKGPYSDSPSQKNELSSDQGNDTVSPTSFAAKRQAKLNVQTDKHQLHRTPSVSSNLSESLDSTPVSSKTSSRTPRVKTTAQLLEEMASSGSLNLSGSEAVRKIALNQIDKEHDDDSSIVPAGAKPRPRKKPKTLAPPQINEKTLHETKHEMVHKFLETSLHPPPTPDIDLSDSVTGLTTACVSNESPKTGINNNNSTRSFIENGSLGSSSNKHNDLLKFVGKDDDAHLALEHSELEKRRVSPVRIKLSSRRMSSEQTHDAPAAETAEIVPSYLNSTEELRARASSDPWSLLPEIDPDSIQWDSLDYEPSEPVEATPSVIERLHSEQWSGVNGQYDTWGDWRNWTQTYTASSYNGDLLHILPYVVLEQDANDDTEIVSNISSDPRVDNTNNVQNDIS